MDQDIKKVRDAFNILDVLAHDSDEFCLSIMEQVNEARKSLEFIEIKVNSYNANKRKLYSSSLKEIDFSEFDFDLDDFPFPKPHPADPAALMKPVENRND